MVKPITRRNFFTEAGTLAAGATLTAGGLLSPPLYAIGQASQIDILHLVYGGGNWQPRPTALRRLAWEIHKRTSVDIVLEPSHAKPHNVALSKSPLAYMSGDRPFTTFDESTVKTLNRYLQLGGTLIIDPAYTTDGDAPGFKKSVTTLLSSVLPGVKPAPILPGHVIFRSFYNISRAVGRQKGSAGLTGYSVGNRIAVILGDHDMAGAWARDNLGNWELEVRPGGEHQRENAFRLGVNLVMYALCLDYKNEQPHRRFGKSKPSGD